MYPRYIIVQSCLFVCLYYAAVDIMDTINENGRVLQKHFVGTLMFKL